MQPQLTCVTEEELIPDITFINGNPAERWVADVAFVRDSETDKAMRERERKYDRCFGGKVKREHVVPIIFRYNGTIYKPSWERIEKDIPCLSFGFICRIAATAAVRYENKANEYVTKRTKTAVETGSMSR